MPKNIVICCDGTGNSFDNVKEESNVVKIYTDAEIDATQIGYYQPGVGTMGDPNAEGLFRSKWSKVKGLAFGQGLLDNVGDAYRYLMHNYEDGDSCYRVDQMRVKGRPMGLFYDPLRCFGELGG